MMKRKYEFDGGIIKDAYSGEYLGRIISDYPDVVRDVSAGAELLPKIIEFINYAYSGSLRPKTTIRSFLETIDKYNIKWRKKEELSNSVA